MIKLILAGRTDLDDYFGISGVFQSSKLNHTPFLAFIKSDDTVTVQLVRSANELLKLSDDTDVMGQWPENRETDYFQFTVGQYRRFLENAVDSYSA